MWCSRGARVPAVSIYLDSDTIGVWPGDETDEPIFRRGTAVPSSDGEEGWEKALCRTRTVEPLLTIKGFILAVSPDL
jgi:hypothetical protein